jgi:nucleoid-associated protein YejK
MHLDFDKKLLHESIEWDAQADELTITVSAFPKLADKLNEADR